MSADSKFFNKGGMVIFIFAMVIAPAFFLYILLKHPGPIDTKPEPVARFTAQESEERAKQWKAGSPEMIAYGKSLYQVACLHCHQQSGSDVVVKKVAQGQWINGGKETDIYRTLTYGIAGSNKPPMNYLSKEDRWSLVHYMRSLAANAPKAEAGDWKAFAKEGI